MRQLFKVNCRNSVWIEGYVTELKTFKERKEGQHDRDVLSFKLQSINLNSDGMAFISDWIVYLHKNKAVEVGRWLKELMLVEVEGKMRKLPNGDTCLHGVYVTNATPDLRVITLETKEEANAKVK